MAKPLPEKSFFRIGEVASIVGVEPHVLRYWESEFVQLAPQKTRGSHRRYSRRDLEIATRIRQLLHDEGLTIAGAQKRLRELGEHRRVDAAKAGSRETALRAELLQIRADLVTLLGELRELDEAEPEDHAVVVEAVVPAAIKKR